MGKIVGKLFRHLSDLVLKNRNSFLILTFNFLENYVFVYNLKEHYFLNLMQQITSTKGASLFAANVTVSITFLLIFLK